MRMIIYVVLAKGFHHTFCLFVHILREDLGRPNDHRLSLVPPSEWRPVFFFWWTLWSNGHPDHPGLSRLLLGPIPCQQRTPPLRRHLTRRRKSGWWKGSQAGKSASWSKAARCRQRSGPPPLLILQALLQPRRSSRPPSSWVGRQMLRWKVYQPRRKLPPPSGCFGLSCDSG